MTWAGRRGWGQGGVILRDHIFRARARLPSQSQCVRPRKAEQAQLLRWTHRSGLSRRKHWALESTVQMLTLGGSSRGVHGGGGGAQAWCKFFALERCPVCTRLAEST